MNQIRTHTTTWLNLVKKLSVKKPTQKEATSCINILIYAIQEQTQLTYNDDYQNWLSEMMGKDTLERE